MPRHPREADARFASVHQEVAASGLVAPVAEGASEERLFLDHDLASLAENQLGEVTDPRALDENTRARWSTTATSERPLSLGARSELETAYWLLDGSSRVGTVALARGFPGDARLRLSSLYVVPDRRRCGVTLRFLDRLQLALKNHGLGLRLETSWTWQRTAAFYLRHGFWVRMWKRELDLAWDPDVPDPTITIEGDEASIAVASSAGSVTLARARRHGEALELHEPDPESHQERPIREAAWHATGTLALAIALRGWPLVRSRDEWARCHWADAGPPEALAAKIEIWEAWAAHRGFRFETPRIPGLEYPTWETLQARWEGEASP